MVCLGRPKIQRAGACRGSAAHDAQLQVVAGPQRSLVVAAGIAALLTLAPDPAHAPDESCLAERRGVNILVSPDDLAVTRQEDAPLPELPPGTASVSRGPPPGSCGSFDGVVVIGSAATLAHGEPFYGYSRMQRRALVMFVDWVNGERGGLRVGDKTYGMRCVWVDDGGEKWQVTSAVAHAVRGANADFAFAGYSSDLSKFAAQQSHADDKVMMTWGTAVPSVHSQNDLTFGLMPRAPVYSESALAAIAEEAEAIDQYLTPGRCGEGPGTCKASIRVGFIQADALFTNDVCEAAPAWAEDYGLTMARNASEAPIIVTVPKNASIEEIIEELDVLRAAGVNVVVGCTYYKTGRAIIAALEKMDFSPLATVLTSTVTDSKYADDIESGWWQGEYFLGPAAWTKDRPGHGQFTGLNSTSFAAQYNERFGSDPEYQAAAAYAAAATLSSAIEEAGSLATADVAAALRAKSGTNALPEFYATVEFNSDGQLDQEMLVTQFAPRSDALSIVAPPELQRAALQFPTPAWGKRRCALGLDRFGDEEEEPEEEECSGHGSCKFSHEELDEEAEYKYEVYQCVCDSEYKGENCAEKSWFLAVLLVALLGAIVLGIGICSWWFHIKRQRRHRYTTFISHAKKDGGQTAAHLHTAFDKALLPLCTRRGPNFIDTVRPNCTSFI